MKLIDLFEAKSIFDYRHSDVFSKLKYWPEKDNPLYINPKDGFHFIYVKGELVLFSTANESYSQVASSKKLDKMLADKMTVPDMIAATGKLGSFWNQLGGLVEFDKKLITISKEDAGVKRTRVIYDLKDFQGALKNLKTFGISDDFKIKGTVAPVNGKTIEEILKMKPATDQIFGDQKITMYHGTSISRWEEIQKIGLVPGKFGSAYVDLIPGYSEHNVYLATDQKTAEFYGKRQAKKDKDNQYVIIEVDVPDVAKIRPDDEFARRAGKVVSNNPDSIKDGLKMNGSIAYHGKILPKFLKAVAIKKA